jgi:hypothetical protein
MCNFLTLIKNDVHTLTLNLQQQKKKSKKKPDSHSGTVI